jgi:phosphatidylglycerophosphatase A
MDNVSIILNLLKQRGVFLHDIAKIVLELQQPYSEDLTMEECLLAVEGVIRKREVQYSILTGVALDQLAEEGKLPSPLQEIVTEDNALYGIDEVLAFGIVNVYGTIGFTSFGYLDKTKIGIIGKLDCAKGKTVNTFLDDLVAGLAAAASAKIAHQNGSKAKVTCNNSDSIRRCGNRK